MTVPAPPALPSAATLASSALSRRAAAALMAAVALAAAAGLVAWGPVVLAQHMHRFADTRTWLGTPSGVNVWTHLPLLLVGMGGLWRAHRLPRHEPLRTVWAAFFCCQMVATAGGIVYHWRPTDLTYIWDQLPRSSACALFAAAFLAERVDRRMGNIGAVAAALGLTLLGGAWWAYGRARWGTGDLRPLIWLEFAPIALVATGAWRLSGHLLSRQDWLRSLVSFVIAQTVDWGDGALYAWTGQTLSGHAARHLALAACVGWVAWRLGAPKRLRRKAKAEAAPAACAAGMRAR